MSYMVLCSIRIQILLHKGIGSFTYVWLVVVGLNTWWICKVSYFYEDSILSEFWDKIRSSFLTQGKLKLYSTCALDIIIHRCNVSFFNNFVILLTLSVKSFSPFVTQIDNKLPSFFCHYKNSKKITGKWDCGVCQILKFT